MQAALQSWIPYDASHHFPLENIPFGAYHTADGQINCCTRIGDFIIDLAELFDITSGPLFSALGQNIFRGQNLNKFASLGKAYRIEARQVI